MYKMKQKIAKFILFVYNNHIQEDWDILTPLGKFFIKPAWFINSLFIYLISPIFIPQYMFVNSNFYKRLQMVQEVGIDNIHNINMKEYNKNQTRNFLNRK